MDRVTDVRDAQSGMNRFPTLRAIAGVGDSLTSK
jgi:hypothetical protein